ncbi:MAG: 30S ribosomal protein S2 [Candidatus Buchananbacteria bacterium RIFCSPHIGHO2_02_FULL_39_17]|nr:MAG: 30S ribosomal protein S2 [Candidatus Buchananbacteria bacterium RIFCSPHIGHO2_02_FULL_39_17]
MSSVPDLLTLLKAGAHFGHQLSRRNPKMEPYIFTSKGGFHIINLEKTQEMLAEAAAFIKKLVANGGIILFLGTKKQAQPIITRYAKDCNMPFVTERWLGGTFTNFSEITRMVRRFTELKKRKVLGQLEKYTKKERLDFDKEIEKMERMVGGIENLSRIPDAIYVCDVKKEKTAVDEAIKKNIPVVAICDTNVNPDKINYVIPANDDSVKSLDLITSSIAQAVKAGLKEKEEKVKEAKATVSK